MLGHCGFLMSPPTQETQTMETDRHPNGSPWVLPTDIQSLKVPGQTDPSSPQCLYSAPIGQSMARLVTPEVQETFRSSWLATALGTQGSSVEDQI